MSLKMKMTGDWKKAGIVLKNLSVRLYPAFELQLQSDGEFVLEKLREHIDSQDLNWSPLSDRTIELKGGDDTILVNSGELRDGLCVRRVKSATKGSTFFIGASPWKKHTNALTGESVPMDSLMIWLEYGTDKMPPRPLIQPTYEEVMGIIEKNWESYFKKLCKGG